MFAWMLENHEVARNLGLVIAATLGILLGIWRSFIAEDQRNIAEKNHLADTYTRAIDQLGREEDEIRLGGLYALEKIAQSNKQYHGQIMEVLCAFVRLHASYEIDLEKKTKAHKLAIQRALTILGRRTIDFDNTWRTKKIFTRLISRLYEKFEKPWIKNFIPNPQETLVAIDLNSADLPDVNLFEAFLSGANLEYSNLKGADIRYAFFSGANLAYAGLEKADLEGATLEDVDFEYANLKETDLSGSDLQNANLKNADLTGANLSRANLEGAVVTLEQLKVAKVFKSTVLPVGIDKEALTLTEEEEDEDEEP